MTREFVIQPNCSLTNHGRLYFLTGIGFVMLGVAAVLAFQGFWLVMPFMGIDLALLVYAFHIVGQRCQIVERVIIDDDTLIIRHEEKHRPRTWSFPLHWVTIELRKQVDQSPLRSSQLLIGSHGNWVQLADFLDNEERSTLAQALRSAVLNARQPKRSDT